MQTSCSQKQPLVYSKIHFILGPHGMFGWKTTEPTLKLGLIMHQSYKPKKSIWQRIHDEKTG